MDLRSIINTEAVDSSVQRHAGPITPIQAHGSATDGTFNEKIHTPRVSINKHPSQDQVIQGPTYFQNPYQGPYQTRPSAPPPLQPPSQNDCRSPVNNSHFSAQSPYGHQSVGGGQFPFPCRAPQSPSHSQSLSAALSQRETYFQSNQNSPRAQHQGSYSQHSPTSNTPVSTPGATQAYFSHHQSQSISTPTSAQSQPFYNQFLQDSPVSTKSFPQSQPAQHQQSHPATPLGPPLANPRHSSGGFPQPTSPYEQRPRSSGPVNSPYSATQASPAPQHLFQQRLSSTPSLSESHRESIDTSGPRSYSDREQSMSVSPKTQHPSLPRAENPTSANGRTPTPKRKIDDSELDDSMPKSKSENGSTQNSGSTTSSGPIKKRIRYTEPPIWAQSVRSNTWVNSKQGASSKPPLPHPTKPESNGELQISSTGPKSRLQTPQVENKEDGLLGKWEPSIMGDRPHEELSRLVADWLYMTVVRRDDAAELASRGVEIEIEAKLGQLIDKDTKYRFSLPVRSECILTDTGRTYFQSSMTEAQHKLFNDFLNETVKETHPGNPNRAKPRVPVVYAHRRERDTFYELPRAAHATLPGCIRAVLNTRHTVKVRVTYDQKSGDLLAKIIKARVADLDIYNPQSQLDCRISVNLEMRFDGDLESLTSPAESRLPVRNKDRLSYTHSHYQIDLTQVTVADPSSRTEKDHELEVELSAAAVREQGRRAAAGEPNKYAELVEGFMDNVRVLTRKIANN